MGVDGHVTLQSRCGKGKNAHCVTMALRYAMNGSTVAIATTPGNSSQIYSELVSMLRTIYRGGSEMRGSIRVIEVTSSGKILSTIVVSGLTLRRR